MENGARLEVQVSLRSRLPGVSAVPERGVQNDQQPTFPRKALGGSQSRNLVWSVDDVVVCRVRPTPCDIGVCDRELVLLVS